MQGCKKVKAQGIGVHKPEEIEEFGKHDLKVLSDILADKPFYFGDEPTTVSEMRTMPYIYYDMCKGFLWTNDDFNQILVGRCFICRAFTIAFYLERRQSSTERLHHWIMPKSNRPCITDQGTVFPRLGRNLLKIGSKCTFTKTRVITKIFATIIISLIDDEFYLKYYFFYQTRSQGRQRRRNRENSWTGKQRIWKDWEGTGEGQGNFLLSA